MTLENKRLQKQIKDLSIVDITKEEIAPEIEKYGSIWYGRRQKYNISAQQNATTSGLIQKFERVIVWQNIKPKSTTYGLSKYLKENIETKVVLFSEHSETGYVPSNFLEIKNTMPDYGKFIQNFSNSVIITLNPTTKMPFIIRKTNQKTRLILISNGENNICYDEVDSRIDIVNDKAEKILISLKEIIQINTHKEEKAVYCIKGEGNKWNIKLDRNSITVYIDKEEEIDGNTMNEIVRNIYIKAKEIYIPNNIRIKYDVKTTPSEEECCRIISKESMEGVRLRIIRE